MDYRVEAAELFDEHIAQVDGQRRRIGWRGADDAIGEVTVVEPNDVVARSDENWHHHGTEIALVAGDENTLAHGRTPNRATASAGSTTCFSK